jgi:glycosyltransferase involved in cell wall biosynthesis
MRLIATQPNYCVNGGVSYTCLSLMDQMGEDTERAYWAFLFAPEARRSYSRDAVGRLVFRLLTKLDLPESLLIRRFQSRVLDDVRARDVVWIWPGYSEGLLAGLHSHGAFVVTERVNTCGPMARRRVGAAYAHLGLNPPAEWKDRDEASRVDALVSVEADAVFAPNSFVHDSLLEIGCPAEKILDTSYGWCPVRLAGNSTERRRQDSRLRFLYVGTGCVRKGLPLLLRAWRDAGVDGELLIAGEIHDEVHAVCGDLLHATGVVQLGHVQDIAAVYHSSDVFVFPTHEEGGPQVTFEAAGCGLALVVSEMGAAGAFRDATDAIVLDPYAHDAWVATLRNLDRDRDLLLRYQRAARQRAADYTWHKVARRRLAMLQARFGTAADPR